MTEPKYIEDYTELTQKEMKALRVATTVLWLNDRSDYINGLWDVLRAILGDDRVDDEKFNLDDLQKTVDYWDED